MIFIKLHLQIGQLTFHAIDHGLLESRVGGGLISRGCFHLRQGTLELLNLPPGESILPLVPYHGDIRCCEALINE